MEQTQTPPLKEGKSPLALSMKRLGRNKLAMAAFAVVVFYILMAIASQLNLFGIHNIATQNNYDNRYVMPFTNWSHPLGTDNFGRDVMARAVMGTKISLFLGFLSGLIMIPIAIVIGAIAGYYSGYIDDIATYIMSVVIAIPEMLIILSLIQVVGRSFFTIAFAFAITGWVGLARIIRGSFMQSKEFEYVLAAKNLGASDARIIFRHIVPNIFHFVIVKFVLNFVSVIKSEVFLAYIGLSIIGVPTWGTMLDDAKLELMSGNWQNMIAATGFMFIFLVCLNIFGDAVRDALDPKLKNVN
ncbi:ABC transporter permease [Spirochaeta cellobiosiphila]|uniref:ABC transporter permease n=1 Tax=Spirochaeta cellobiosiphila TaxID=504483 RepID=UPI0004222E7A|nr:ABC transporter permease [Spirochaeta cellobiosiphila]